jgi:hypothetical protein
MIFGFEEQANVDLMGELVNDWYASGNWNPPSGVAKADLCIFKFVGNHSNITGLNFA